MKLDCTIIGYGGWVWLSACAASLCAAEVDEAFFETQIRPVLIERCFECHGRGNLNGDLRVDSRDSLIKGGETGPAIVPGNAESSLLVRAIRHTDAHLQMPPKSKLSKEIVGDFEQWINAGAPWPAFEPFVPKHWAFEPVKKVAPPTKLWGESHSRLPGWISGYFAESKPEESVSGKDPGSEKDAAGKVGSESIPNVESILKHPIDRFVATKWVEQNLTPAELADARTLVRRLYFDLIGLPPSATEMEQAVAALTPWSDGAWGSLIERLLESPRYGERWGRHWLDVVRYADTAGDNADYPVPEARLYRDYVIDSFNSDKPYDQFVREQLAGDILAAEGPPEEYASRVAATGFLALSRRYATAPYELWHLTLEDTIDTVGQALMGITFRCARCHDHKFDPVTQQEYYSLYGIFESTQFPWAGGEEFQSKKFPREHFVPLIPAEEVASHLSAQADLEKHLEETAAELERESPLAKSLASLTEKLAELKAAEADAAEISAVQTELNKVKKQLDASKAEILAPKEMARRRGFPEAIPIAYAVREGTPRSTHVQRSGDPGQVGPVANRGVPSFLTTVAAVEIPASESGRKQLAEWLTRPDHPLTTRVFVNRLWQHHFGRGLVTTSSNFGVRGAPPTHPELLDWLAQTFVENQWSIKSMHRLILTSNVWRLASSTDAENARRDPGNVYLWRHDRRRLEAEAIRDAILAVSGQLDLSKPGEHPFPPILKWNYTQHSQFRDFYPSRHRSVYLMTPRLQRHPYLALFDSPDTNTTTGSRTSSIVPAQSLYLMNGVDMKNDAEALAQILLRQSPESRLGVAYQLAFQRSPNSDEAAKANEFVSEYTRLADEPAAWTALCRSLLTSHEFFYVD
jgi:hypothetical protein